MKSFFTYYFLTLVFYLVEITIFALLFNSWKFDIFWLNIMLRSVLAIIFSIFVRNLIFTKTTFFYAKIFVLILLNPFLSSLLLKLLIVFSLPIEVLLVKFLSDLLTSILIFFILKKIS